MKLILLLLTAAVLASLVFNAEAETRYDELLKMHQNGALTVPARVPTTRDYLCYSRLAPDVAIHMSLEANVKWVRQIESNSAALNALIADRKIPLSPTQLPIFNGPVLGGRGESKSLMRGMLLDISRPNLFLGLSVHTASQRNLAAILKLGQEDNVESACQYTESLEYLCIENSSDG